MFASVLPRLRNPCYYGIDTSVRKELIASTHTEEEISQYIGADSLHYISLAGLKRSLNKPGS
jgi:amidophosphoribosyltransferase